MKQCSDIFAEAFSSNSGGIVRTCSCGITTFNYMDRNFFDEGELEELEAKQKVDPTHYHAVDYTVTTMTISGNEIVHGCTCGQAKQCEKFILANARSIARYLRLYAEQLRKKADLVAVPDTDIGE